MGLPWYIITGDINIDNFNKLLTYERGFIWRGFTHAYQMIPPAANYDQCGKKVASDRTEQCHPLAEIKRVAEQIFELNKLQKFPFEIPPLIRDVLFPRWSCQPLENLFEKNQTTEFPDSSLSQAMSLVQHEFGGTSLLDFSLNRYKALYFAIGKEKDVFEDSQIFGLNVPYFETHKDKFTEEVIETYGEKGEKYDILYPSYFMNDKIARQEGVFLYQKFNIGDSKYADNKYKNIIKYFESRFKNNKHYEEISLDKFLDITGQKGDKPICYFLLTVPAGEKGHLKAFLNNIGITDNYMMNAITTKEPKIKQSRSV
jgi:hypothetical protein